MSIPKIFGIETEWSIFLLDGNGKMRRADIVEFDKLLSVLAGFFRMKLADNSVEIDGWEAASEELKKWLKQALQKMSIRLSSLWAPNGARIYVDYPHFEYSTPECLSVKDLVAADQAENLLLNLAAKEVERLTGLRFFIYKDNSDRQGSSWASHENYLLTRMAFLNLTLPDRNFDYYRDKLLSFLATRQIFAGSGKLGSEKKGWPANYQISQRADFINQIISGCTILERGLINTRDEPHADSHRFARLHLILGESNMCQMATFLRIGTTAIVLRMYEDNFIKDEPHLADPLNALWSISRDLTCQKLVLLRDGRRMSPIEIQRWYLDLAKRYFSIVRSASKEEEEIMKNWEKVLSYLSKDKEKLIGILDWPTKLFLISRAKKKYRCSWNDKRLKVIDAFYHSIDPRNGYYWKLLRRGIIKRLITDKRINFAMRNPPQNTRAYLRAKIAQLMPNLVRDWEIVGWRRRYSDKLLTLEEERAINLEDPFRGTKKETDALLKGGRLVKLLRKIGGEDEDN